MGEIRLRDATPMDVPSIRTIHNQGIEDRVATLDVDPHTLMTRPSGSIVTAPVIPSSSPNSSLFDQGGFHAGHLQGMKTVIQPFMR